MFTPHKSLIAAVFCVYSSFSFAAGNPDLFKGILLQPSDKEQLTVVVELARGTMSLIRTKGKQFDVVEQLPVSIGKNGYGKLVEGDKRTPVGVYNIDGYIADEELPARYGIGAFTLDYPNFLDRKARRTGSGIWIHGIDKQLSSRPYQDSDGCVVIDNEDLHKIKPVLDRKPVVVLTDDLPRDGGEIVSQLTAVINDWEAAWESLDVERYLSFYSEEFDNGQKDYRTWVAHKRRVGAQKTSIDVELSGISLIRYPGESTVVQAEFKQKYVSNNFRGNDAKRQYWKRLEDGSWRIIYEASI